jgi:hypothetical protein
MEEGFFYPTSGSETDAAAINTFLKLSINERNWDYIVASTGPNFNATAQRQGSGGYLDCEYVIDTLVGTGDEPVPNSSCQ